MNPMLPKKRRLRYLIDRHLQLGLAFRFLAMLLLFSLFMLFEAYMTFWPVMSEFIPEKTLTAATELVLTRLAYFSIPILFVVFGIVTVLTHRIAGPLHRIKTALDDLIQGKDVTPITLRKNDELKDLSKQINRLIPMINESRKEPLSHR